MAGIYFTVATLAGMLAWLSAYKQEKLVDVDGFVHRRFNLLFAILLFSLVIFFVAFRKISAAAIDEYVYRRRFDIYQQYTLKELLSSGSQRLLILIYWISAQIFSTNQGVLIITGSLIVIFFLVAFKKYSLDYAFAVVLFFVTSTLYNSFNGIAQYLAAALYLVSVKYMCRREFVKYLIVILLCTSIHAASLILLPIYFIALDRTNSIKASLIKIIILISIAIAYRMLGQIIAATGMLSDYTNVAMYGHHGVSIITIAINCVPALVAIVMGKRVYFDKVTTISANICVLNAIIFLASSMDVYIARLSIFTSPFVIIFLSRALNSLEPRTKFIAKACAILLYSIVCFLLIRGSGYTFVFSL